MPDFRITPDAAKVRRFAGPTSGEPDAESGAADRGGRQP